MENEKIMEKNVPSCEDMKASSKCKMCGGTGWADLGKLWGDYHFVAKCSCNNEQQA